MSAITPPSPETRRRMQSVRQRDTRPELEVRRALYRLGLRYRVHQVPVPGLRRTADVVFRRAKVAVFVDGCFWHRCPRHATSPMANSSWWEEKLAANEARDHDTNRVLADAGWEVVRVWEHEMPDAVADRIKRAVETRLRNRSE